MCIGGRLGADMDIDAIAALDAMSRTELLYSESASRLLVSVRPEFAMMLDMLGQWQLCRRIGTVTDTGSLSIRSGSSIVLNETVEELVHAFKRTLDW